MALWLGLTGRPCGPADCVPEGPPPPLPVKTNPFQ